MTELPPEKPMKPAVPPAVSSEDTLTTGVRQTEASTGTADAPFEGSETMSGRREYPLETWDEDEEAESQLPVPEGELLGGKYTVDRIFAGGGMGIVCLGRHVQLDQPVAIKFLRRTLSGRPSIVQRFLNEARALAALRSEHVVRVMDVGQLESGRPYLVMEHLEGVHLDALLERDGPLSVELALSYALQVCEPLAEAHALGIVHRDIKPENLFLWSGGPNTDTVKVLDFGLAKHLGSSKALGVTGPQDSIGSPSYMSPEQITTPQLVDSRTDIWSLGVVLYRLLTGKLPFDGDSLVEALSHILNATPTPLTEVSPNLDSELDLIVRRCLEKLPDARYQTTSQLADALSAYLAERRGQAAGVQGPDAPLLTASPSLPGDAKIRIPGVHSRVPAALLLLLLLGGAAYAADRSGKFPLRRVTDGWLSAGPLAPDAPAAITERDFEQGQPLFRGIFAADPAREAGGEPALPAVPERELTPSEPAADEPADEPVSDDELARKRAAYEDYLKSQGMTRLPETVQTPDSEEPPPAADEPTR